MNKRLTLVGSILFLLIVFVSSNVFAGDDSKNTPDDLVWAVDGGRALSAPACISSYPPITGACGNEPLIHFYEVTKILGVCGANLPGTNCINAFHAANTLNCWHTAVYAGFCQQGVNCPSWAVPDAPAGESGSCSGLGILSQCAMCNGTAPAVTINDTYSGAGTCDRKQISMNGVTSPVLTPCTQGWTYSGPALSSNTTYNYTVTYQTTLTTPNCSLQYICTSKGNCSNQRVCGSPTVTNPEVTGSGSVTTANCAASPAPTVNLTASPGTVRPGASSNLTWTSAGATSCTSGDFTVPDTDRNGFGDSAGSAIVAPTTDVEHTISCVGPGGIATARATIDVLDPSLSITAAPTSIRPGGSTILTWSAQNVDSCTVRNANNGSVISTAISGSQNTGSLTQKTTYTYTCLVGTQSRVASVIINITPSFEEF